MTRWNVLRLMADVEGAENLEELKQVLIDMLWTLEGEDED